MTNRIVILLASLLASTAAYSDIIYYNFVGSITQARIYDPTMDVGRQFEVGDSLQAIYTVETDTQVSSGSRGGSSTADSTFGIDDRAAVMNFRLLINGIEFIDDYYRLQQMRVINGRVNGRWQDWLELTMNGGFDTSSRKDYGLNSFGEYVSAFVQIDDTEGTVFDPFQNMFGMPTSLDINDFELTHIQSTAKLTTGDNAWFLRGEFDSIRSDSMAVSTSVSEPTGLFSLFLIGLGMGYLRKHVNR